MMISYLYHLINPRWLERSNDVVVVVVRSVVDALKVSVCHKMMYAATHVSVCRNMMYAAEVDEQDGRKGEQGKCKDANQY